MAVCDGRLSCAFCQSLCRKSWPRLSPRIFVCRLTLQNDNGLGFCFCFYFCFCFGFCFVLGSYLYSCSCFDYGQCYCSCLDDSYWRLLAPAVIIMCRSVNDVSRLS